MIGSRFLISFDFSKFGCWSRSASRKNEKIKNRTRIDVYVFGEGNLKKTRKLKIILSALKRNKKFKHITIIKNRQQNGTIFDFLLIWDWFWKPTWKHVGHIFVQNEGGGPVQRRDVRRSIRLLAHGYEIDQPKIKFFKTIIFI